MTDGVTVQKRGIEPTHAPYRQPEPESPPHTRTEATPRDGEADDPPKLAGPDRQEDDPQQDSKDPLRADGVTDTATRADPPGGIVAAPPPVVRRGGRWFPALCALLAMAAASVALAAPWLRPQLDIRAREWFGDDNLVSRLVTPPPAIPQGAPVVVVAAEPPAHTVGNATAMIDDALQAHLAPYDDRLRSMAGSLTAMDDRMTRAIAALRADAAGAASLPGAIDALSRRADQLQAADAVLAARARASALLALAIGLRRDVDAGVPIDRDCAALAAIGHFPAPVAQALQQLTRLSTGVPTMRDLAEAFDPVQARLAAHAGTSAAARVWTSVKSLFGAVSPSPEEALRDHVRALAVGGRFSEAAKVLETSDAAALAADWIAMVRARVTAVIATQTILTYTLQATEAAYADAGAAAGKSSP